MKTAINSRKNGHKTFTGEDLQLRGEARQSSLAGLVLDSVGEDASGGFLSMLRTSVVVYDKHGACRLSALGSGWCRFLDEASPDLAGHSHTACWAEICQACLRSGKPVDVACRGGIRAYAVPLSFGGETIGSIGFGYGDPPKDLGTLQEIADRFGLSVARLAEKAGVYESCPSPMVELCKCQLRAIAGILGVFVESKGTSERTISGRVADGDALHAAFHEMRGLLTVVKGCSGMLLDYGGQLQSSDKRRYLEAIGTAADGLAGLMDRLRDICLLKPWPLPLRKAPAHDLRSFRSRGASGTV